MKNYRTIIFLLLIFSLANISGTFAKEKEIYIPKKELKGKFI